MAADLRLVPPGAGTSGEGMSELDREILKMHASSMIVSVAAMPPSRTRDHLRQCSRDLLARAGAEDWRDQP